ncbi:MAG: hypothetical protein RL219_1142 [Actinomycetota bacterium]
MGRLSATDLADIEAIKKLKAQYFYFLDNKQWDRLRTLFTDDADFDSARIGEYQMDGPDNFVEYARQGLTGGVSVHHGHMPIIDLVGDGEATGIWAMVDYVEVPDGAGGTRGFTGYGHYHERYRRVGEEWRISGWALTRLRVDPL